VLSGLIPNSKVPLDPLKVPGTCQLNPPEKVASGIPGPVDIISLINNGEL